MPLVGACHRARLERVDPLWLRARSELRSTWRATVLLALLFAIGGGCALTAFAGARRTQTAMPRFVAYNRPEDVSLFFPPSPEIAARVLALPEVAQTRRTPFLMVSTDPSKFGSTVVFGAAEQ